MAESRNVIYTNWVDVFFPGVVKVHIDRVFAADRDSPVRLSFLSYPFWKQPVQHVEVNVIRRELHAEIERTYSLRYDYSL